MNPNQFILAHESIHLFISAIIGFILWRIYGNRLVIIISILAGVLIDSDHLFDLLLSYINVYGANFKLGNIISIFYGNYMSMAGKVYVLFHSLDLIWIWWFVGRHLNKVLMVSGLQWALLLPILAHILVDHASYTPHPLAYFLLFRMFHNFDRYRFDGLWW